jgi:ABC-type lipoprotein export system ATPase subunit
MGQTIVMVTHDAEVAAADRTIHLRDGQVVDPGAPLESRGVP